MGTIMQTFESPDGYVAVRLDPGDLVLESIEEACEEHDIDTGAVVSGIGTFRNLHIHSLHTDDLELDGEEMDTYFELDGCWEINGIQGLIAGGEPHLHLTAFDGERTVAGHLEGGNETNALCEILIKTWDDDFALTREPNRFDIPMLEEA